MRLVVNNNEIESKSSHLEGLIAELDIPVTGVAVAVNRKMVRREHWKMFKLQEGMDIIIIKAVCGG